MINARAWGPGGALRDARRCLGDGGRRQSPLVVTVSQCLGQVCEGGTVTEGSVEVEGYTYV